MCHKSCLDFCASALLPDECKGKVLEVGSLNVNGSPRGLIEQYQATIPSTYVGIDIQAGPGVDVVCDITESFRIFGPHTFDLVVSTEMLEHVEDWRGAIDMIKTLCKPGGIILLTTRSPGFHKHSYPHDYWRFTLVDMANIFSDCEFICLENDPQAPGVFVKVRKPTYPMRKRVLTDYHVMRMV